VQIIPDHNNEKITKIGAQLTKLSQESLALAFMECQSFQKYLTSDGSYVVNNVSVYMCMDYL